MSRATTAAPHDHIEVEWQFDAADLDAVERWLWSPVPADGFSIVPRGERQLDDTYYDTADAIVGRAGFTLRVRRRADRAPEITLKATEGGPAGGALRSRVELSASSPSGLAELASVDGRCGEVLRALVGTKTLAPLFEVHTSRRVFDVALERDTAVEVALDRTLVHATGREASLARVEIELAAGAQDAASTFVAALRDAVPLTPAAQSKFGAGALLAELPLPAAVIDRLVPGPRTFRRRATAHEAARAVLRGQLAALLTHEPAARLGADIEGVHQMRVATRRMRAGIRVFADALPPAWSEASDELRWLAGALGVVRDVDVQLATLEAWAAEVAGDDHDEHAARLEVVHQLQARHVEARDALLAALDSPRYEALVGSLTELLHPRPRRPALRLRVTMRVPPAARDDADGIARALGAVLGSADGPRARVEVGRFGRRALRRSHRRYDRAARALRPDSPPEAYHGVRIAAKWLRYAGEFLAPLYGREGRRFIAATRTLQDRLGEHQDAYVAEAQLRALALEASGLSPRAVFAMGELAASRRGAAAGLRAATPSDLRRVDRRWRKLRERVNRVAR